MQRQMRRGAAFNYLNLFIINATGLVLTPFIIRCLGPSEYGLYVLAGAIVPYLTLLDFGLGKTTTRYVARYCEQHDDVALRSYLHAVRSVYLWLAVALLAAGALIYAAAPALWGSHFTAGELATVRRLITVITLSQAIVIPGNVFTAVCNGCGYFAFPRAIQPIKYILRAVAIGTLLVLGEKALALIIVDALLNVGVALVTWLYVRRRVLPPLPGFKPAAVAMRPIFGYAFWIAIYQATCALQWTSGQIVTGMTQNATAVGIAGIGILLGSMYGYFAETINRMLMPHATHTAVAQLSPQAVTDDMIRIARMVLLPQAFILGGFAIFGDIFVSLWAGTEFSQSFLVALLIMISWTVQLTGDYGNSLLEAHGNVKLLSFINFICIFAGTIASYFASRLWGALGMTVVLCCGTVAATIATHVYYRRQLKLILGRYFNTVYTRIIAVTALIIALGRTTWHVLQLPCDWLWLATACVVYAVVFAALIYVAALNENERERIKQICSRK